MKFQEILQLSVAERIQIVEDVWDSIALEPKSLPLTETERQELERRLQSYRKNPDQGVSWDKLQKKIANSK